MKANIRRNETSSFSNVLELREDPPEYICDSWKRRHEEFLANQEVIEVRCPETPYQTKSKLEQWFKEIPVEFPSHIDMSEGMPAFFNPMIGQEYKETCQNVSHVLEMLRNLALPSYTEKADFSLTEEGTLGFVNILECMTSALRFERNYRNNDYGSGAD